jgi:hypothetical protein
MNINLSSSKSISVDAKQGNKSAPWHPCGNHYRVTIKANGRRATFDFWDSLHNQQTGKEIDLRGAISCFASDVMTGMNCNSVDDIASEFGYDKPSEALRVFKGVKKAQKQAERLDLTDEELSELMED